MGIIGIGTDLVVIERIDAIIQRHGERFVERVLHVNEMQRYRDSSFPARFLAKRFAAKEAISKAIGTGIAEGVALHDIEIVNDALGKPHVRLHGVASQRMAERGASQCHLSLSDERDHALAFAVLE